VAWARGGHGGGGCYRPYAAGGPWNMPIPAGIKPAAASGQLVATVTPPLTSDPTQFTYPVYVAGAKQTPLPVHVDRVITRVTAPNRLRRSSEGAQLRIPIPRHARGAAGSDGQVIVLDPSTQSEWGFWQFSAHERRLVTSDPRGSASLFVRGASSAFAAGTEVAIGTGRRIEYAQIRSFPDSDHVLLVRGLSRHHPAGTRVWGATAENGYSYNTAWSGVPPSGFGSRGAGMPYLAGLVRRCEIVQHRIDHALALAFPNTTAQYVYPARKSDGEVPVGQGLPEGARLQLNPSISAAAIHRWGCDGACLTIARALQRYGMFVVDTSGRSKLLMEYQGTAHWGGGTELTADTVSRIPVGQLRLISPGG
jgi:hypothetical protein